VLCLAGAALNARRIECGLPLQGTGARLAQRTVTATWSSPDAPLAAVRGANYDSFVCRPRLNDANWWSTLSRSTTTPRTCAGRVARGDVHSTAGIVLDELEHITFFHPFTTTLVELATCRELAPFSGPNWVPWLVREAGSGMGTSEDLVGMSPQYVRTKQHERCARARFTPLQYTLGPKYTA